MDKTKYLLLALLAAISSLVLSSCDDDDLCTDQFGGEIRLNTFGPVPVLRGGVLNFIGSNLDQIESVTIPGAQPITAINILAAGKHSQISIEVPRENCTEGKVILTTKKGETITTLTPVTYIENIKLDAMYFGSEGNLSGRVGDVLTIKGDYLNLIHAVYFADNAIVAEDAFDSHDRYTIAVKVPANAKSGRIQLSDENPDGANMLFSEEAIEIALPTVALVKDLSVKSGQTITLAGTSLDQIERVVLAGAEVDEGIEAAADGKSLAFALPDAAADGEIELVTLSGVALPAGNYTTVVPTGLSASPAPAKNGATITIAGQDLDIVRSIAFAGADAADMATQSPTKITATVPETATDGDITLTMGNGKTVAVAYTLVKPTVAGFTPASLMAGEKVMIQGTDLDLVASVAFPGDGNPTVEAKDFVAQSATAIGLNVPATAEGNGCTLNLKNGTTVEAAGLAIAPATDPAVATISEPCNPGKECTITGKNFNNMEQLFIGSAKVKKFLDRNDTQLRIVVPDDAPMGTQPLKAITYDGKEVAMGNIEIAPAEVDLAGCIVKEDRSALMPFPYMLGSWNNQARVMRTGYTPDLTKLKLTAGVSKLIIHKEVGTTGQCQVNDPNWGAFDTPADWGGNLDALEMVFTQAMIDCITGATSDGWSETAFILQGDGLTITKIGILP